MRRQLAIQLAGFLILATLGCAKPQVWVPPRMDLQKQGTLGLIEFESDGGYGTIATEQFLAAVHAAQTGVPVLELGPLAPLLRSVGHATLSPDAVRAIGKRHRVDVVVVGALELEKPRPNFSVRSFTEAKASAEILGTLNTRFLDAGNGATTWSDRASGKRTLAHFNVVGGQRPQFGVADPEGEEAKLVSWLVSHVTGDFRGHWARQ
jgi:hypothetical protein